MSPVVYPMFSVYGIETELMVVHRDRFEVKPVVAEAIGAAAGVGASDFEDGAITWSNELVAHVLEFKYTQPLPSFSGQAKLFHASMMRCDELLAAADAMLLPGAAHPWMDPRRETVLWPHEGHAVYATYDRLFDCHRHGWANLQSVHLNLPFADDQEFAQVHAAARVVMCLLPGLTAGSPFQDGRWQGAMDQRLRTYAANSVLVPQMTGPVVPEAVWTAADYRKLILDPLSVAVAALDPSHTLQGDWLNARGVIARFDRMAVEIRVIDAQECPLADVGMAAAAAAATRMLAESRHVSVERLQALSPARLRALFAATVMDASAAVVSDPEILAALGQSHHHSLSLRSIWTNLLETEWSVELAQELEPLLHAYRHGGTLAERMVQAVGLSPTRADLMRLLQAQRACLLANKALVL